MNFLAHLYLSGQDEQLLTGNFIGDYVKGRKFENYPSRIREGILLHRSIDDFTDKHPKFREAKTLLTNDLGLYSGIVIDMFYDYFLASNWNDYSSLSLHQYARWVHAVLLSNFNYLPPRVKGFLPFLIQNKRLESYATIDGIQQSLEIMSHYTSLPDKAKQAISILKSNKEFYAKNFKEFMEEMLDFVQLQ